MRCCARRGAAESCAAAGFANSRGAGFFVRLVRSIAPTETAAAPRAEVDASRVLACAWRGWVLLLSTLAGWMRCGGGGRPGAAAASCGFTRWVASYSHALGEEHCLSRTLRALRKGGLASALLGDMAGSREAMPPRGLGLPPARRAASDATSKRASAVRRRRRTQQLGRAGGSHRAVLREGTREQRDCKRVNRGDRSRGEM